jgi:acyl-CoA synthetase (NDP forming)
MHSVREVLDSRRVAVIGASRDPMKPGAMLIRVLQDTGFQGKVAGVNPHGGEIHGVKLYKSLKSIPFPIDLAVLLIPAPSVPTAVAECASKCVKGVVISTEGFAEAGPEGRGYQEALQAILRSSGMRGFGPNTLGVMNTATGLTTSYYTTARMLRPGSIGFVAQSGIFLGGLMRYLSSFEGLKISKGLGLGNKVDVDESEALAYLSEDEQTRVVGMYLEGIKDGRKFLETVRNTVVRKPVLLLKGGRTPEGVRAAGSHTASMAVEDALLEGALRQAGVLRMKDIEQLIGTLMGFQYMPLPRGPRLAIATYSGAQAVLSVDAAVEEGLQVVVLGDRTRERLAQTIAAPSKTQNPVDLFPDVMVHGFEQVTAKVLEVLLGDDDVDGIIFIALAIFGIDLCSPLVKILQERRNKPVFFSLVGDKEDVEACRTTLEENLIPCYPSPEAAVRVLAHIWRYASRVSEV